MKMKLSLIPVVLLVISVIGITAEFIKDKDKVENVSSRSESTSDTNTSLYIGAYGFGYSSLSFNIDDVYNREYYKKYLKESSKRNGFIFFSTSKTMPPWGGWLYDTLFSGNRHADNVKNFIANTKSPSFANISYGFYERRTLKSLCEAQRSTYETEDNTDYGFRNNNTQSIGSKYGPDQYGASGVWAQYGVNSPGYLVSGLIVNTEQSDNYKFRGAGPNDDSVWHIKPAMRIDSADARRLLDSVVARLEIYNFAGDTCRTVELFGSSFFDHNGICKGGYVENYYLGMNNTLTVTGNINNLNKGANVQLDSKNQIKNCKVDYRIWWTGRCNLWVDYVRLDDGIANQLFKIGNFFVDKIGPEISELQNSVLVFYDNEISYNNLPALKLVSARIKQKTGKPVYFVVLPFPSAGISSFDMNKGIY